MNYIEAPQEYNGNGYSVFLAGSISDDRNWQSQLFNSLRNTCVTIFNPRRKDFPIGDRIEERRQIEWERRHLARANLVVFWLTAPTLCPIALFELGACCESGAPLVLGIDSNYALKFDIRIHLSLRRPDVNVHDSLDDLARSIVKHAILSEHSR